MQEGFDIVTPEHWAKLVEHVIKVEEKFWEADGVHEDSIEQFIIRVSEVIVRVILIPDIKTCKPLLHNSVYQCIIHSCVYFLLQCYGRLLFS